VRGFNPKGDTRHFDKTFTLNACGAFFTVQKLLPLMKNGDSIIEPCRGGAV
jgi:NAD(P)-dependent dehydrogenase (short-subunit alcohol dehydrogenase family)